MCGLTGYNGLKPADPNKIKILAIFNEQRGRHSCGIFSGGKLGYGHEGNKLEYVTDYLQKFDIPIVKGWHNVMVHMRAATVGAKTLEGCHPFEYKRGNKRFFFMHNGTITNWKDLVKEAGLNPDDYISDSKGIGAIIFKKENCKVFQEYKGAGSFVFCDNQDKNTMWVYRGAAGDKEERPLYCWFDNKNQGIYISSMMIPLKIISGGDMDNIKIFAANTLCKLTNGKIVETTKLERNEKLHEDYKPVGFHQPYYYPHQGYGGYEEEQEWDSAFFHAKLSDAGRAFFEQTTQQGSKVVWSKGRYWRNGHLLDGEFEVSDIQYLTMPKKSELMPGEKLVPAYFIEGVLMTDKSAYETLINKIKTEGSPYLYPLCNAGLFKVPFTLEPQQTNFVPPITSRLQNKVCMFYNNKSFKIPFTNAQMRINTFGEIGEITFLAESSPTNNGSGSSESFTSSESKQLSLPIVATPKITIEDVRRVQSGQFQKSIFRDYLYKTFGIDKSSTREELVGFFTAAYPEVKVGVIKGLINDATLHPKQDDVIGYVRNNLEWGIENQPGITLKNPQEDNPFLDEDEEPVDERAFELDLIMKRELGLPIDDEDDDEEEEEEDIVEQIQDWYKDFDDFIKDTEGQIKDLRQQARELGIVDQDVEYLFNYLTPLFDLNKDNAQSSRKENNNGEDNHRGASSAN